MYGSVFYPLSPRGSESTHGPFLDTSVSTVPGVAVHGPPHRAPLPTWLETTESDPSYLRLLLPLFPRTIATLLATCWPLREVRPPVVATGSERAELGRTTSVAHDAMEAVMSSSLGTNVDLKGTRCGSRLDLHDRATALASSGFQLQFVVEQVGIHAVLSYKYPRPPW